MSKFKKVIRFLHLWLGLLSGIIVFIVAATGCLYSFEKEFRALIYKDITYAQAEEKSSQSIDNLRLLVKKKYPKEKIKSIVIRAEKNVCVEFVLPKKKTVYVNPYSSKIQGLVNSEVDFFGVVLKIHRSLYLGDVGKKITGISAIVFLVMLISGIILWWPKRIKRIKEKLVIALRANKSRRNYDLHSVLGFYASIFLLFVVLTGLIWSFKSVENSMYWITGSTKEENKMKSNYSGSKSRVSLQKIMDVMQKSSGEENNYFISLPEDSIGVIKFRVQPSKESYLVKRNQYTFDQYEYKLLKIEQYEKASIADKIKMNLYNIHTGKILGLAGQLMIFIASSIAASLPITGFLIWRRKRK